MIIFCSKFSDCRNKIKKDKKRDEILDFFGLRREED
jgi:hypothetical protein